MTPALKIKNLHVAYSGRNGEVQPALAGVNFELGPREILGVLGESGSGKSTLAAAVLRLLPSNGKIEQGSIFFEGKNLLEFSPQDLRTIRGGRIGLILQEPSASLHPTLPAGRQVSDVLAAHELLNRRTLAENTSQLRRRWAYFPLLSSRIERRAASASADCASHCMRAVPRGC
jgi:ABC-type glutathione transport system ATPase component